MKYIWLPMQICKKKGSSEFKIKQDVVTAECILEIKMNR